MTAYRASVKVSARGYMLACELKVKRTTYMYAISM